MVKRMHVRALPGKRVRLEERPHELLPDEGIAIPAVETADGLVPTSGYWQRRLAEGDVEVVQPAPAPSARSEKE